MATYTCALPCFATPGQMQWALLAKGYHPLPRACEEKKTRRLVLGASRAGPGFKRAFVLLCKANAASEWSELQESEEGGPL